MEPFNLMFYHDAEENVRYFSLVEILEKASNELLERLIDQLSRNDDDEARLRQSLE